MKNVKKDKLLIDYFIKDSIVQTIEDLKKKSGWHTRTLQRKIKVFNLMVSYNKNSRFYTLPSLASFNRYGIWNYDQILFSQYGNLFDTILKQIDNSTNGYTGKELSAIIEVKADDALRILWKKERIRKQKFIGVHVYFSIQDDIFKLQLAAREQQTAFPSPTLILSDYQRTIAVLVDIIQQDSIVVQKLKQSIAKRHIEISIDEIQTVIEHYNLKKKKNRF